MHLARRAGQNGGAWLDCTLDVPPGPQQGIHLARLLRHLVSPDWPRELAQLRVAQQGHHRRRPARRLLTPKKRAPVPVRKWDGRPDPVENQGSSRTRSETAPRSLRLSVRAASQPACPRCFSACVLVGRQADADKVGMSVVK